MENAKHIKVLTIRFTTEISPREIPLFRGAILSTIGTDVDILYHNHTDNDGFRYSYPLIQYKRIGGKAAIVCIDKGVDSIGQFLMTQQHEMVLGERSVKMEIESVRPQNILMQTWQDMFNYRLQHWIPLNSDNYRRYQELESLVERIALLEGILKGNLLSMCKGLDIYLSEELKVSITNMNEPHLVKVKGVKVMSFDVDFRSNLSIPDGIGIGKNVSLGYGTTLRKRFKKNKVENNNDQPND